MGELSNVFGFVLLCPFEHVTKRAVWLPSCDDIRGFDVHSCYGPVLILHQHPSSLFHPRSTLGCWIVPWLLSFVFDRRPALQEFEASVSSHWHNHLWRVPWYIDTKPWFTVDVQQIWTFYFVSHSCCCSCGNYCLWNVVFSCWSLATNQEAEVLWLVHLQESRIHYFPLRIRFQHVRLFDPFCSSGELNYFRWISYVHFYYFFYRYYSSKFFLVTDC